MTTSIVRLDRLQAGLTAALASVHAGVTVVWAPSEFPRAAATDLVIACRLLAGPDGDPIGGDTATPATLPMTATLRVLAPVIGAGAILFASGRKFERTFASIDPEAERDAWLADILVRPMVDATFEASGADAITIEALEIGDLYKLAVRGSASGLVSLTIDTTAAAIVSTCDVRSWIELQAYSSNRYPRTGAAAALNRIRGSLRLPSIVQIFDTYGIGVTDTPGRVVTLDALAGPAWESRSALSFYVAQLSLAAEAITPIDRVYGTIQARGATAAAITLEMDTDTP